MIDFLFVALAIAAIVHIAITGSMATRGCGCLFKTIERMLIVYGFVVIARVLIVIAGVLYGFVTSMVDDHFGPPKPLSCPQTQLVCSYQDDPSHKTIKQSFCLSASDILSSQARNSYCQIIPDHVYVILAKDKKANVIVKTEALGKDIIDSNSYVRLSICKNKRCQEKILSNVTTFYDFSISEFKP